MYEQNRECRGLPTANFATSLCGVNMTLPRESIPRGATNTFLLLPFSGVHIIYVCAQYCVRAGAPPVSPLRSRSHCLHRGGKQRGSLLLLLLLRLGLEAPREREGGMDP